MKLFIPRYYFVLRKTTGYGSKMHVDQIMYLKNGKFKTTHQLFNYMLLTWPQVVKFNFLFWWYGKRGNNEKLFDYSYSTKVTGIIILQKLF